MRKFKPLLYVSLFEWLQLIANEDLVGSQLTQTREKTSNSSRQNNACKKNTLTIGLKSSSSSFSTRCYLAQQQKRPQCQQQHQQQQHTHLSARQALVKNTRTSKTLFYCLFQCSLCFVSCCLKWLVCSIFLIDRMQLCEREKKTHISSSSLCDFVFCFRLLCLSFYCNCNCRTIYFHCKRTHITSITTLFCHSSFPCLLLLLLLLIRHLLQLS